MKTYYGVSEFWNESGECESLELIERKAMFKPQNTMRVYEHSNCDHIVSWFDNDYEQRTYYNLRFAVSVGTSI